jgi:ketosteroid isomerase-like protein
MERPEIVELFYSALVDPNDVEQLSQFLSSRVEWILSAADPQTSGEESPSNAIKFSGKDGFQELVFYLRDSLHVISGDLTGCITHHQLVFAFGRVRLRSPRTGQLVETNLATKITFQGSKIVKGQIRISWPLVF